MIAQLEIEKHPVYELNPVLSSIELPPIPIALDLETNGLLSWANRIRVIALNVGGIEYLVIPEYYTKEELTAFFNRLKNNIVVCHNTKFDAGFIYTHYGVLLDKLWCTMLGSQILQGGLKYDHSLKGCLNSYLGITLEGDKKELQKSFLNDKPLTPEQLAYAAQDTRYLVPLKDELDRRLNELGLEKIVRLENTLTPVLVKMEAHGMLIDVDKWKAKLREWEEVKRGILAELDEELMKVHPYRLFMNVNYESPKQLANLFKEMGLPVPSKKDKSGTIKESVDENTLNTYLIENPNTPLKAFIERLLDYREYTKLLSTYGESFLN